MPLVLVRGAVAPDPEDGPAAFEDVFRRNGWTGCWRNGIYPYHHYHSTAHEVLGVASGSARVCFGGEGGTEVEVASGDVVVIPAGVAHKLVEERNGFLVVGAYAGGRHWDLLRPRGASLEAARQRIAAVPLPDADPVAGADGVLLRLWGEVVPEVLT
nr:cupin domain-containing protein [Enterovirga sp. DB1703]